jgi:myosin-like protein
MRNDRTVFSACRLSRSGFSGERVFRVIRFDGSEHVGVAPTHYCRNKSLKPLGPDAPPKGHPIEGWIEGILIDDDGEKMTVALPDGNTIKVKRDQVKEQASVSHVSIGS